MDQQDVGPSGVATGSGAFHFRSSSSVGDEENPHGWKLHFTGRYLTCFWRLEWEEPTAI
ncbi:hypothetical protein [Rummeliibacillus suwonensis]|uniref:hypothetical protein n=1 Tax=Rummeliibacillus suwonensis TaxID=1306154 RepID=UPI0028A025A1|nr:hypothetical protein [Rummeliibacillus suwonensis]